MYLYMYTGCSRARREHECVAIVDGMHIYLHIYIHIYINKYVYVHMCTGCSRARREHECATVLDCQKGQQK